MQDIIDIDDAINSNIATDISIDILCEQYGMQDQQKLKAWCDGISNSIKTHPEYEKLMPESMIDVRESSNFEVVTKMHFFKTGSEELKRLNNTHHPKDSPYIKCDKSGEMFLKSEGRFVEEFQTIPYKPTESFVPTIFCRDISRSAGESTVSSKHCYHVNFIYHLSLVHTNSKFKILKLHVSFLAHTILSFVIVNSVSNLSMT